MAKSKTPRNKYNVDDEVQSPDGEVGVVKSLSYNPERGWQYAVSSVEVDVPGRKLVEGVKTLDEDELSKPSKKKGEENGE